MPSTDCTSFASGHVRFVDFLASSRTVIWDFPIFRPICGGGLCGIFVLLAGARMYNHVRIYRSWGRWLYINVSFLSFSFVFLTYMYLASVQMYVRCLCRFECNTWEVTCVAWQRCRSQTLDSCGIFFSCFIHIMITSSSQTLIFAGLFFFFFCGNFCSVSAGVGNRVISEIISQSALCMYICLESCCRIWLYQDIGILGWKKSKCLISN